MAKKKAVKKIVPISVQGTSFEDMINEAMNMCYSVKTVEK